MSKKLTRAQSRILKASRPGLRLVTKAERLAHPEKFSPTGRYLVPKGAKITARSAVIGEALFKKTAIKENRPAQERYATIKTAIRALRGRTEARALNRLTGLERVERPSYVQIKSGGTRGHYIRRGASYRVTDEMKAQYENWRDVKLSGGQLADGDWQRMMDMARAIKDPQLGKLAKSNQKARNLD